MSSLLESINRRLNDVKPATNYKAILHKMENGRKIIENAKKLVEKLKAKVEKNEIAMTALYQTMMGDQVCIEVFINNEVYLSLFFMLLYFSLYPFSCPLLSLFYLSLYRVLLRVTRTFKNPSPNFF